MNLAKKIGKLPLKWVTASDISADGNKILVKTYMSIFLWERQGSEDISKTFQRQGKALDYELEPQGEAVCWDNESKGYFTLSEKSGDSPQIFYYYPFSE